jgi:hypothetical protein
MARPRIRTAGENQPLVRETRIEGWSKSTKSAFSHSVHTLNYTEKSVVVLLNLCYNYARDFEAVSYIIQDER